MNIFLFIGSVIVGAFVFLNLMTAVLTFPIDVVSLLDKLEDFWRKVWGKIL